MAHVLSVNVGRPRAVDTGRRSVLTAIWKAPVQRRVAVRGVNVDGDDQADRSVHGGPDKAVCTASLPDHGVTPRVVSDALLRDRSLIPQVLEAPQLIPSPRDWMTAGAVVNWRR
jgi:hypothetical protein